MPDSQNLLIENARFPTSEGMRKINLLVQDGRVAALGETLSVPDVPRLDAAESYLLPGFVDVHTNGAAGFDFSYGLYDLQSRTFDGSRDAYFRGLERAANFYLQQGATTVLLTTIAAPVENLERAFRFFAEFKRHSALADVFGGIYIEGSFIADPHFAGAHNPKYFLSPSYSLVHRWQELAEGGIRVVNLPPEHGQVALDLIPRLTEMGILTVAGHSGAYFDEFEAAVQKGLRGAVHLFNGPMRSFYKSFRGGGAFEAALSLRPVFAELICDFYHVAPQYLRDAIFRKTPERILAVTDSMFVTGIEKIDTFRISQMEGSVSANGGYLQVKGKPGTLFGSVLTMKRAFENLVALLAEGGPGVWREYHPALPFEKALFQAVQMTSLTPHLFLKKTPLVLRPGAPADFVLADIQKTGNSVKIALRHIFKNGRAVATRELPKINPKTD